MLPKITDPRIPQIVEARLEGQTWDQVGNTVGLCTKQIYNIRQKEEFQNYVSTNLAPKYELLINRYLNSGNPQHELEILKELGRMIRTSIPKEIHQRTEKAEIKIVLHDFKPQPQNPENTPEN